MKDNGERLRNHLRGKKLSMNRCARMLGIADLSVWRYVSGLREPTDDIRKKMKKKLGFEWKGDI